MVNQKKFVVSHAPFWHNGSSIPERSLHMMLATIPAVLLGVYQYGILTVRVIALSVAMAMIWEMLANRLMKSSYTIGDGNAALIGLLFAMLLPATIPWWAVVVGTFVAILIGKQIYGGIGGNPFNPVLVAMAVLYLSWGGLFDFNEALVDFDFDFNMVYPLAAIKQHGAIAAESFSLTGLLMGQQSGGIGATFGLGLILGGIYLIVRGVIRWELAISFLFGVFITALIFNLANPVRYAPAEFHLLTGFTLIAAFFLVTEDSSSPVNFIPMLLYGAGAGAFTVIIRNVGIFVDGTVFAILIFNIVNPLLDKIRPKALGKVNQHA